MNVVSTFRSMRAWPTVMRLVHDGVFGDVSKLITHTFSLEDTLKAFETQLDRSQLAIKIQVSDGV